MPNIINYKHDKIGNFAGISWSELIINKKENPMIQTFHEKLCKKLDSFGIKPLNAYGDRYNPHFTLFNIQTSLLDEDSLVREIPESFLSILGKSFSLTPILGVANNDWELTNKIFQRSINLIHGQDLLLEEKFKPSFSSVNSIIPSLEKGGEPPGLGRIISPPF